MRFPQLPIGQRFEFDGSVYCKLGPVSARDERSGQTRMIPRSAEVTPLGSDLLATTAQNARVLNAEAVRAALAEYHAACLQAVSLASRNEATAVIETARLEFLRRLGLNPRR